ncbi:hypothetical protein B4Q10_00075, partial [Acinetobacter baumannii]
MEFSPRATKSPANQIKSQGFGEAINITLGLPFIRTSVDHGTALSLAG